MSGYRTDGLERVLAQVEHERGMPVGTPDHCHVCDREVEAARLRRFMEECTHPDWMDITGLGDLPGSKQICARCGQAGDGNG